jgi:riboflavin synthase
MFTGIVELAEIEKIIPSETGWELWVKTPHIAAKVKLGDSVAIDGACLTVTQIAETSIQFFVSPESIQKTIIYSYIPRQKVNIELPLQPTSYLGGHYVLGHVDCVATVNTVIAGEKAWILSINIPEEFIKYVVYKGSVAISGVSLTINQVLDHCIELCIIPATLEKTNLGGLKPQDIVNIEFDILAKYTEQLLQKSK